MWDGKGRAKLLLSRLFPTDVAARQEARPPPTVTPSARPPEPCHKPIVEEWLCLVDWGLPRELAEKLLWELVVRAYCRPGATPLERLESYVASRLCSREDFPQQLAELLSWATSSGPARSDAIRAVFPSTCVRHPGEALGMARAVLVFCGVTPEREMELSGHPREDFVRLMAGRYRSGDLGSPDSFDAPNLIEGYCYMGASFSRGVDLVFRAVTGQPLSEHLSRALRVLGPRP